MASWAPPPRRAPVIPPAICRNAGWDEVAVNQLAFTAGSLSVTQGRGSSLLQPHACPGELDGDCRVAAGLTAVSLPR